MNFNLYLEDSIGIELTRLADETGRSRNALIREAIADWLKRAGHRGWPDIVEQFEGDGGAPVFESYRSDLHNGKDDPLA